ncbi:MAG: winged helix-turn-helix domain-containing protein [Chthoniobacteraceae bacterium]
MERRRRRGARMFEKECPAAEVGRRLGVSRQVAHRWKQAWERGGEAALRSKGRAGPKARVNAGQTRQVVAALLEGPRAAGHRTELWTLPRVRLLIEKITGVRYHPGHVWKMLGALGFSCQRPERRAIERDEGQIRTWQRKTWPALKKTRGGKGAASSLWTRAD